MKYKVCVHLKPQIFLSVSHSWNLLLTAPQFDVIISNSDVAPRRTHANNHYKHLECDKSTHSDFLSTSITWCQHAPSFENKRNTDHSHGLVLNHPLSKHSQSPGFTRNQMSSSVIRTLSWMIYWHCGGGQWISCTVYPIYALKQSVRRLS